MLSREQIFERVWGSWGDRSAVSVYVRKLRDKLEADARHPQLLVTVWGVGYRFDPPAALMRRPLSLHVWLGFALALAIAVPALAGLAAWAAAGPVAGGARGPPPRPGRRGAAHAPSWTPPPNATRSLQPSGRARRPRPSSARPLP